MGRFAPEVESETEKKYTFTIFYSTISFLTFVILSPSVRPIGYEENAVDSVSPRGMGLPARRVA